MDNNDNVMIGSPGASPRARATFNTSPNRRYNHNFVWTNSNSNTNENNVGQARPRRIDPNALRRMRRARMTFMVNGGRRLNFANNNNRPNTSNYMQNIKQIKKNTNQNNTSNKIPWKNMKVKNFPRDPISTNWRYWGG